jgi:hypothetical protein
MPNDSVIKTYSRDPFFNRLPAPVADKLTDDQRIAIAAALPGRPGDRPPVNIRLSIPLLRWRFYFAMSGGKERRGAERRSEDRGGHPVKTKGNIVFLVIGAMAIYVLTLGGILLSSSILEI